MNNTKPLVTVVCLTYRKYEYIYRNIDSVLNQDYSNIEYIISDDGCDLFPKEDIENYLKNRNTNIQYKVISHSLNQGTVKHINEIYSLAKGEILVPLSADDEFSDNSIVTQIVNSFEQKNCSILVTARWFLNEDTGACKMQPAYIEQKYISKHLIDSMSQLKATLFEEFFDVLAGSTLYMRKDFFEQMGGFDESYRLLEDWPFFTDYTSENTIDFDFSILAIKYRAGGVSNSGKGNKIIMPDIDLYNSTTRIKYRHLLDSFSKKKLDYVIRRTKTKSKLEVFMLYVIHPIIMFTKIRYKAIRIYAKIYDRFHS